MVDLVQLAQVYLPKYLTPSQKEELYAELRSFSEKSALYLAPEACTEHDVLQGDGWRGLIVVRFESGERRPVAGLILSNSCDIAPANPRPLPTNVVFAPLVDLERYKARLHDAGQTGEQIDGVVESIRKQEVTSMFYLPAMPYGPPGEWVAFFDDVHAHPAADFLGGTRVRVFRLNMVGLYLLLLKLSIHFCRLQEGVQRFEAA